MTFVVHLLVLLVFLILWFSVVGSFHSLYKQLHAADLPKRLADLMMHPAVVLAGAVGVLVIDGLFLYAMDRSRRFVTLRVVWSNLIVLAPAGAILIACVFLIVAPVLSLPGVITVVQDDEFKSIAGTYQLLRSERHGRAIESTNPAEVLTIEEEGRYAFISWTLGGTTSRGLLALDLNSPKRLHVRRTETACFGQTQHGLYRVEDDQLTICFSPLNTPLQLLPTMFATADSDDVLLVYQRTGLGGSE